MDKNITLKNKFSVLISVYYKENPEHLRLALKSVWDDQIIKPDEIVLVQDGPLTKELNITINNFIKEAPVKLVCLDKNYGLGIALAKGIEACSYDIVARMDSDDVSMPSRFEKQLAFLISNPNVDIVGGHIAEFHQDPANIISYRYVPLSHSQIQEFLKKRSPFNHPTVMYRKKAVLGAGNYKELRFLEDYYLWLRVISKGYKCANLDEVILKFRMNRDVIGRRQGFFYFKQELKLLRHAKELGTISNFDGMTFFFLRALPRLLPTRILAIVYKIIRSNHKDM